MIIFLPESRNFNIMVLEFLYLKFLIILANKELQIVLKRKF